MEEVDKKKALKQVIEASLKEKTLELNVVERRAAIAKKVRELAEQNANIFNASSTRSKLSLPSEEEESAESPKMRELSHQIDSHVLVLDEDSPATTAPFVTHGATQLALGLNPLVTNEAPLTSLVVPSNLNS
nr:hypothetical protein CFP56_19103 [Quercus suber]